MKKSGFLKNTIIILAAMVLGMVVFWAIFHKNEIKNLDEVIRLTKASEALRLENSGLKGQINAMESKVENLENEKNTINEKYNKIRDFGGYGPFFMDSIRSTNDKFDRYYGNK